MLKKRIVATLIVRDGILVQSVRFSQYLPVGDPIIAIDFFNRWGIDEIVLLDISASKNGSNVDLGLIRRWGKVCFVPMAIGGGIRNLDQVRNLIANGADKILLNHAALHNQSLITKTAEIFGSQCVLAAMDVIKDLDGYHVYDHISRQKTQFRPDKFACELVKRGAGEIFINSVDRDGTKIGFDLELINKICAAVPVPIICCGGAGRPKDFVEVFQSTNVNAASASNFFHFAEHNITLVKAELNRSGVFVRYDTQANYLMNRIDPFGRLLKKSDEDLERLTYVRLQPEII